MAVVKLIGNILALGQGNTIKLGLKVHNSNNILPHSPLSTPPCHILDNTVWDIPDQDTRMVEVSDQFFSASQEGSFVPLNMNNLMTTLLVFFKIICHSLSKILFSDMSWCEDDRKLLTSISTVKQGDISRQE